MPAGPMTQAYQPHQDAVPAQGLGLPVPSNQVTTKPRQMPSGGGPGGAPGDAPVGQGFGDGPEAASVENAQPKMPDIRSTSRHVSYTMSDVMADILEENPSLGSRQAYLLAKRVIDEFDLVKTSSDPDNPLAYGDRGKVQDGPITDRLNRGKPKGVPAHSPSRRQPTVQEEHARAIGRPPVLDGTLVPSKEIGPGQVGIDPPGDVVKMVRDEGSDGGWAMEAKRREAAAQ